MKPHAARKWLCIPLLLCAISQAACLKDEGDNLGAVLNATAAEMLARQEQERTLVYHPAGASTQPYSIQFGKHYACFLDPCDAPYGEDQGGVLVQVESGRSGTGFLSNHVRVPRQFEVDKRNTDTRILLRNKGWYVEVVDVF